MALSAQIWEGEFTNFGTLVTFDGPAIVRGGLNPVFDPPATGMPTILVLPPSNQVFFITSATDSETIEFEEGYDSVTSPSGGLIVPVTLPITPL